MSESEFSERIRLKVEQFDTEMLKEQNDAEDLAKRQQRLQEILAKKAEIRPQIARQIREDAKQAAKHYPQSTRDSYEVMDIRVPVVEVEPAPRGLLQFLTLGGQSPDRTVNRTVMRTTREPISLWFLTAQVISHYRGVGSNITYLGIVVNNDGDLLSCEKTVGSGSSIDYASSSLQGYSGYRPTTDEELVPLSTVPASMSDKDTLSLLQAWQGLLLKPIDASKVTDTCY